MPQLMNLKHYPTIFFEKLSPAVMNCSLERRHREIKKEFNKRIEFKLRIRKR